ncbi:hypothetical protein IWW52_004019 [Coemansia sp. RSA 2704]|nr:hypothetical protein IWW52_004019 [Coemansia sp. RSA 2704]
MRPQQMPPLLGEQPQAPGRMPALGVRNSVVRNARRYHSITVVAEPPLLMETGHEFFGAPPARRPRRPRQPDAARRVFTTPMPSLMQALASSSSVASTCCEPAPADAGPAKQML